MTATVWGDLARQVRQATSSDDPPVWGVLGARLDVVRSRPNLGAWVVLRRFDLPGGNSYAVVGNRRDLVYYRLSPAEADVLELIDGQRTVGEIVVAHLEASGELDMGSVVELVRSLHRGNFLTHPYVDVEAALTRALDPRTGSRARAARFLSTLTVEWSGAERMVQWWHRRGLRHLFAPTGVALALVVALVGFATFLRVSTSEGFHLSTQRPGLGFAVLFVLNLTLIYFHELGHTLCLLHSRPGEIGGLPDLLRCAIVLRRVIGRAAPYHGQRIAQAAAGPYVEAVCTGIVAILLWRFPHGATGQVLYRFCFLGYFVLLLNLVPLLELDGYWILSDMIQVPDLRPRSLTFIRRERVAQDRPAGAVAGTLGGRSGAVRHPRPAVHDLVPLHLVLLLEEELRRGAVEHVARRTAGHRRGGSAGRVHRWAAGAAGGEDGSRGRPAGAGMVAGASFPLAVALAGRRRRDARHPTRLRRPARRGAQRDRWPGDAAHRRRR